MKLVIGGTRGTSPVARCEFAAYGGETTAFLVEGAGGERILVDAGTGVRQLGHRLQGAESGSAALLFTHYHLDHVMGLPSLSLIYSGAWNIRMAAPPRHGFTVAEVLPRLLHEPFWPLQLEDMESGITYTNLPGPASREPLHFRGLEVSWCPLRHPGGCTAYRFDEPATGGSVVLATDVEWRLSTPEEQELLLQLCRAPSPARLLVMDGQFTDATYAPHRGWGHSTWEDVLLVGEQAGVGRVLITHHDPRADDATLAERERAIVARAPTARLAREMEEHVPA